MRYLPRRVHLAALLSGLVAAGTLLPAVGAATGADSSDSSDAGRRIYTEGILPSGDPLSGAGPDDVQVMGAQAACVKCHRRSGLGVVQGGTIALPVTGDILYRSVWRGRPEMEMARTTGPNVRPAYTDESLAKAIVTGIGANDLTLDRSMPRYALSDAHAGALVAYLKTLSSKPSPGADATTIRFATIVAAT